MGDRVRIEDFSIIFDFLLVSIIFFLCLYLLGGTLRTGYPRHHLDATVAFYIAKIKMLLRNRSLFTESWYFGYEMLKYYPPLSTVIPAFFANMTGKLLLSYYFLCFFFYTMFCLGIYMFVSRFFSSRLAGVFSGVLWVFTHVNFISFQGHYWETSRLIGTAATPWVLYFIHRTFEEGRKINLIAGVALSSYCLLSNLFSAIDLVVFAGPYLILSLLSTRPQSRGFVVLTSFLVGVPAFSIWWYIPSVLPHGLNTYLSGSTTFTPPLAETFLQFYPPNTMPAIQLPLTILGITGIALGVAKQSRDGFLMAFWFLASIFSVYILKIQSWRFVLLIGICFVFSAGYLIKEAQNLLYQREIGLSTQIALPLILLLSLGYLSFLYLPNYQPSAVVDDMFLTSDEFIVSTWLAENTGPNMRAYLMWGSWFRGSQWVNAFYPEVKQVLGGYDEGARIENIAPFLFDDLVKFGVDAQELHMEAKLYHVRYIVIDNRYMEAQGPSYEKFGDMRSFNPVEDLNDKLRYASVYEVLDVTGMVNEPHEPYETYRYWGLWRGIGLIVSCFLLSFFAYFIIVSDFKSNKRCDDV